MLSNLSDRSHNLSIPRLFVFPITRLISWFLYSGPSEVPRSNLSNVTIFTDCHTHWVTWFIIIRFINCTFCTTFRPTESSIRLTTIPVSSIEIISFSIRLMFCRRVSLAEANLFRSYGYFCSGAWLYRSDRSRILERYNFIYWYNVLFEYHFLNQIDIDYWIWWYIFNYIFYTLFIYFFVNCFQIVWS